MVEYPPKVIEGMRPTVEGGVVPQWGAARGDLPLSTVATKQQHHTLNESLHLDMIDLYPQNYLTA